LRSWRWTTSAGRKTGFAAVLFLCSDQANSITGVVLPVDCGFLLHNAGSG